MTLNQVINRIKTIALAHAQVRNFQTGAANDFINNHTSNYPGVLLQSNGGTISLGRHLTVLNYKMFVVDLVHVAADTNQNAQDVISDTISIALDVLAKLNDGIYTDWRISADNNLQLVSDGEGDMYAGCAVDFSVSIMYTQNKCEVPA